jgi:hypothetical protein
MRGEASRVVDTRPVWTPALENLIARVIAAVPSLAGLEGEDILVVGLAAHGTGAASVRELRGTAARVIIDGRRRRLELGLRPPFLLDGDAPRRLTTLVHELLHLDPRRRGRLLESNRHANRPHESLERQARAEARRLLNVLEPTLMLCLAHEGEVLLRQWRHRPCETTPRRVYGDDDVFNGPVLVRTPPGLRGGWW